MRERETDREEDRERLIHRKSERGRQTYLHAGRKDRDRQIWGKYQSDWSTSSWGCFPSHYSILGNSWQNTSCMIKKWPISYVIVK